MENKVINIIDNFNMPDDTDNILFKYKGSRVFITGHTGFKGSWLAYILWKAGATVCGYALPSTNKDNHFDRLGLTNKIENIFGDIRDLEHLRSSMLEFRPDFVFHLAAQALVRISYEDPAGTFTTNVMGSVNLLEAVRECDTLRALVYVTSDKCYENLEWVWGYRETDALGGRDPYSASKAAAEIVFSAYQRSYFSRRSKLGAASVRAGNVIGGGDWAEDRIIPDCIRSVISGRPIYLRNPQATRPWQHVLEPLSGYLLLGQRLYENPEQFTGAWNFGPSVMDIRTVHQVASTIVKYLGSGSVEIEKDTIIIHEANLLQLSCEKAHQLLGWRPRWGVDDTLIATAKWYKNFINEGDSEIMTASQINEYFFRKSS
jgi:CDP-glucose 4,6-dehydratase